MGNSKFYNLVIKTFSLNINFIDSKFTEIEPKLNSEVERSGIEECNLYGGRDHHFDEGFLKPSAPFKYRKDVVNKSIVRTFRKVF